MNDDKKKLLQLLDESNNSPTSSTVEVLPPIPSPTPVDRNLPIDSPLNVVSNDILKLHAMEELDNMLTELSLQYAYPICGMITVDRHRTSGVKICCERAGANTNHPDVGRCLRHETNIKLAPRSPYTQYLKGIDTLQQIFERFQSRDRAIKDLTDEMNLARAALAFQTNRLEKNKDARNEAVFDKMILCLEMIRKIGKTMSDIQQQEANGITMESIDGMLWAISRIIEEEIIEQHTKLRIFDRISTEVGFVQQS